MGWPRGAEARRVGKRRRTRTRRRDRCRRRASRAARRARLATAGGRPSRASGPWKRPSPPPPSRRPGASRRPPSRRPPARPPRLPARALLPPPSPRHHGQENEVRDVSGWPKDTHCSVPSKFFSSFFLGRRLGGLAGEAGRGTGPNFRGAVRALTAQGGPRVPRAPAPAPPAQARPVGGRGDAGAPGRSPTAPAVSGGRAGAAPPTRAPEDESGRRPAHA